MFVFLFLFVCCRDKISKQTDCNCYEGFKNQKEFYITDVTKVFKEINTISFHCAKVIQGTASITDDSGNESCKTNYDIECISEKSYTLKLTEKFLYWKEEFRYADITQEGAQLEFFDDIKADKDAIYKVNLDEGKFEISCVN